MICIKTMSTNHGFTLNFARSSPQRPVTFIKFFPYARPAGPKSSYKRGHDKHAKSIQDQQYYNL